MILQITLIVRWPENRGQEIGGFLSGMKEVLTSRSMCKRVLGSAVCSVMCQNRLVRQTLRVGSPEFMRLLSSGNSALYWRFLRVDEIRHAAEVDLN
jgi:hypothetical protein